MHHVPVTATVRRFALALGWLMAPVSSASAQARRTVFVTEGETGNALANAEVLNRMNGEALLTNERGEAVLPERWSPAAPLRIRQIGYRFADTTFAVADSTIRVALRRVVYVLPSVAVTLGTSCALKPEPDAALLAATVLEQLQMAAERYNTFKQLHPFRVLLERRTKTFDSTGRARTDRVGEERTASTAWGERYAPRRIVDYDNWGRFTVQLLFLAHLADPAFWQRHCFEVSGVERHAGRPVLRLRFAPLAHMRGPDWEGWALLDSASSELRRIEFRLALIEPGARPQKLEGYTTFMSPIPNIVLPESTVAIWWRNKPTSDSAPPNVLQLIRLIRVEYRGRAP
jgi:hypothetical protein